MLEKHLIDLINAEPENRTHQYVYADWLDEQGDPLAEGWRVLLQNGKQPEPPNSFLNSWYWYWHTGAPESSNFRDWFDVGRAYGLIKENFQTFHDAMDAAAIVWVQCHRDPDFLRESIAG